MSTPAVKNELALRHLLLSQLRTVAGRLADRGRDSRTVDDVRRSLRVTHDRHAHVYRVSARGMDGPVLLDVDEGAFRFYARAGVEGGAPGALAATDDVEGDNARQARQLVQRLLTEAGASLSEAQVLAETRSSRQGGRSTRRLLALTIGAGLVVESARAWRGAASPPEVVAGEWMLLLGTSGMLLAIGVGWRSIPVLLAIPVVALAAAPSGAPILATALCVLSQWIVVGSREERPTTVTLTGAGLVAGLAVAVASRPGLANAIFSTAVLAVGRMLRPTWRARPLLTFPITVVVGAAVGYAALRGAESAASRGPSGADWFAPVIVAGAGILGAVYWTIGTHRNIPRMLLPFWVLTMAWTGRDLGSGLGTVAALASIVLGLVLTLSLPLRRLATPMTVAVTLAAAALIAVIVAQAASPLGDIARRSPQALPRDSGAPR